MVCAVKLLAVFPFRGNNLHMRGEGKDEEK